MNETGCAIRMDDVDPARSETARLFAAGNYALAALRGGPDAWQTYAALGLIGKTREALEGLAGFDRPEARFYAAVARWIEGDDEGAARALDPLDTAHARNLLALVRKPRIAVLAQLPWWRSGPQDLLTGAARDTKFQVRNISFHPEDLPNVPYADVHRYYDRRTPPDFYICQMVEWHPVPPNLVELPCPIFGQTSDYDAHIQCVQPWLRLFDEFLVTDPTEWEDVRRLTGAPVSTFPKTFGIPDRLPPIPGEAREHDVFLSGRIIDTYQSDKARLVRQVLGISGIRPALFNGFMGAEEYLGWLGRSKTSFTFGRRPAGMPTRGLEALAMGCALAVQEGCVLTLFAGESEGVLTYRFEAGDLPNVLRRILDEWPAYAARARQGARIVRREFAVSRVASQYLRFLTVLAARPRAPRAPRETGRLDQRRPVARCGALSGDAAAVQALADANMARWNADLARGFSPETVNLVARELVLDLAAGQEPAAALRREETVSQVLALMREGVRRAPRALVLRFNMARTALHLGRPREVSEALDLAEEAVRLPESAWQVDPAEDIFPWDFCGGHFNYRRYLDLVTGYFTAGSPVAPDLVRLLLASLNFYLGQYSEDPDHLARAEALDPDFPFYKFDHARRLAERGGPEDVEAARRRLLELAEGSILFLEASIALERLPAPPAEDAARQAEVRRVMEQAERHLRILDSAGAPTLPLRPARARGRAPAGDAAAPEQHAGSPSPQPSPLRLPLPPAGEGEGEGDGHAAPLVSAIVSTYNGERFLRGCLEDLEAQTLHDRLEIIVIDSGSQQDEAAIAAEFRERYGNVVYVRTERENPHAAFNRGIRLARGRYLTMANADDRHHPNALRRMAAILEERGDVALVYADAAITATENETLETAHVVGCLRWPDFDRRRLFRGCCVGPQPMWRRELHARYGLFDPEFQIAGDYEFWLRMARTETFAHIPMVLGLYLTSSTSNERVNRIRRHQETERARQKHWPPEWGDLPPWDADYNVPAPPGNGAAAAAPAAAAGPPSTSLSPIGREGGGEGASLLDGDLETGQRALETQAWAEACQAYIRVLERDRDCAPARSGLGLALVALGETEEGLAQLREAACLDGTPDHMNNLACGLIHAGELAEARRALGAALAADPGHAAARDNLDRLLVACGEPEAGEAAASDSAVQRLASRLPAADPAVLRLADRVQGHAEAGGPAPAPGRRGVGMLADLLEAGVACLSGRDWSGAVEVFRQALRVAPDLAEARSALGSALLVLGRAEEAIAELTAAAEALETSPAWNNLGWARMAGGQMEGARTAFLKAIELDHANLEPQRNLAALFEALGMPRDASAAYDLILLTAPEDAEALAGLARCAAAKRSAANPPTAEAPAPAMALRPENSRVPS